MIEQKTLETAIPTYPLRADASSGEVFSAARKNFHLLLDDLKITTSKKSGQNTRPKKY